jgi:hypothetical protein
MPPEGAFFAVRAYRWLHNLFSLATGLGITTNIIDCYAAILSMWEPGDRIFVFGFSRGAYTVRCLAAVLSMCGVPTTMANGKTPLRRDAKSIKKIANEAVKNVYQHVSSPADEKYVDQRKAIALRFRQKYNSDVAGVPNANPYFIGVFDTVASLGSYRLSAAMFGGAIVALLLLSWLLSATVDCEAGRRVYLRCDVRSGTQNLADDFRGPWCSAGEEHSRANQGLSGGRDE